MPIIENAGVSLFYVEKGSGQPIIFVHGIPTDYRAWTSQVETFSDHYRAIAYSRRYAQPNKRDGDLSDSTIENNFADLVGLGERLGAWPVHLVGHSYGGFIGAYFASKKPELVKTLTLIDPAVSTLLVKDPKNPIQFLSLLLKSPSTARSAAKFTRGSLTPSLAAFHQGAYDTALRLNLNGIMNREDAFDQFPESIKTMMQDNERTVGELGTKFPAFTKNDASRISSPTLLINGSNSPTFFHSIVNELRNAIPNSEVARISGSAHFPHLENPKEFNARLADFLQANKD